MGGQLRNARSRRGCRRMTPGSATAELIATVCGEAKSEGKVEGHDHECDRCLDVKIPAFEDWKILRIDPVDHPQRERGDD